MNRDEILRKSREENAGNQGELEIAALGAASRVAQLTGAVICLLLIFLGRYVFHTPEIGLTGWLVGFAMSGSRDFVLGRKLMQRKKLISGIVELLLSAAFAAALAVYLLW